MQTESQQVSENQFLFNIPEADNINHVVVFMTGQMPFPDGLGGAGMFFSVCVTMRMGKWVGEWAGVCVYMCVCVCVCVCVCDVGVCVVRRGGGGGNVYIYMYTCMDACLMSVNMADIIMKFIEFTIWSPHI